MNLIYAAWPWYTSGPAIAFIMFLLLMVGKNFGMSSNLKNKRINKMNHNEAANKKAYNSY